MKTILLSALTLLLVATNANGQSEGAYVTGAVSLSKYRGDDVTNSSNRIGYTAGFELNEHFAENWRFIVGARFTQIGDKDLRVNNVVFPVMVGKQLGERFQLAVGTRVHVFAQVRDADKERIEDGPSLFTSPSFDVSGRLSWIHSERSFSYVEYNRGITNAFEAGGHAKMTSFNFGYALRFIKE